MLVAERRRIRVVGRTTLTASMVQASQHCRPVCVRCCKLFYCVLKMQTALLTDDVRVVAYSSDVPGSVTKPRTPFCFLNEHETDRRMDGRTGKIRNAAY